MSGFFDNFRRLLGWWNSVQPPAIDLVISPATEFYARGRGTEFVAVERMTLLECRLRLTTFDAARRH
jgi:hypothetical protein